jgi:hypothetical protein
MQYGEAISQFGNGNNTKFNSKNSPICIGGYLASNLSGKNCFNSDFISTPNTPHVTPLLFHETFQKYCIFSGHELLLELQILFD